MTSKTVEITNETGLHTRPGNEFVSVAKTFSSHSASHFILESITSFVS